MWPACGRRRSRSATRAWSGCSWTPRTTETVDPGRIVRSQAEFITSPEVLDRTVALDRHRLTRKELSERLTVEPARDADLITIRVLDATPQAAGLADTVVRAYRESVAKQTAEAARREVATLERRQEQLEREIVALDEQRRRSPGTQAASQSRGQGQRATRSADQAEAIRRDAVRSTRSTETVRETATVPDEPAQPKPLRTAAIGAMLAGVAAAALAWWLNGRRSASDRQRSRDTRMGRRRGGAGPSWT